MQHTRSSNHQTLQPCRYGHECLSQYDNPTEHNASYTHPCRWSELCRDVDRDSEHARQYTHNAHHGSPCKYRSGQCPQLTDPEHRQTYRHEGLPDFLLPCKYKDQCRERSQEHLKQYGHPPNFYQQTSNSNLNTTSDMNEAGFNKRACQYGNACRQQSDPSHTNRYSHSTETSSRRSSIGSTGFNHHLNTTENDTQQTCKYGNECRKKSDPSHTNRYSHPTTASSNESSGFNLHIRNNENDTQQTCKYGNECRKKSDPSHTNRYSHPTTRSSIGSTGLIPHRSTNENDTQRVCEYGNACRHLSDPSHTNRYSHPETTLPIQLSTATPMSNHACGNSSDMHQAYRFGAALALEKLSQSDQKAIQNMPADAVIIVPGTYDHIDRVLDSLNIKYITVNQSDILAYPFRNNQTVYINCASTFPVEAANRLRQQVEKGLHIVTTDWALRCVLQVAFSDFVKHNGQSTADEVVGIQVVDANHPLVNGFLPATQHAEPQWWLETGSHPIEIVNKEKVRVLIRSEVLGQKYQSDAVLVTFNCGQGNVIHMISHFYLQRSEMRDARHKMSAKQYAMDSKASTATTNLVANQGQNLNYAQIQSSTTSAQFIYNQISRRLNPTN